MINAGIYQRDAILIN